MDLIIVESPHKAKTIEKYLGGKYRVDASGGHVRDLPEKRLGVNVAENFEPNYVINPDKKSVIKRLADKAAKADKVYLATDPDREGEAISWHLESVLGLEQGKNRIEFHEISEKAVKKALENPREINYNLVDAQQARRVLDRLVGYKLSPLLCKRLQSGLSAGRVQSVALRLVVEKEREIQAFQPVEYWNVSAILRDRAGEFSSFRAMLTERGGKKWKPASKEEAEAAVQCTKDLPFVVTDVKKTVTSSHAPAPFTTSTLQQDGSVKLSITAPQVMTLAQHLYEGIDTPEGHIAFVTYIRTDSVRVSQDAQKEALSFIEQNYGKDYVPPKPNFYKTKGNAQDAHEAIRPIDLSRTPEKAKQLLDRNHYRLYKLIYERFVASQMAEAKYNSMQITIANGDYGYKASGKTMLFKGFTAVYEDFRNQPTDGEDGENAGKLLPDLKEADLLAIEDLKNEQKFTKPPVRFTDATLVKAMEDKGIGRPSTYASIIAVLSKRKYTGKEGKYIVPTDVAYQITDMLIEYFPDVMDVSFTANMETKLDEIEEGGKDWRKLIGDFYAPFAEKLLKAASGGDEITDIVCEKCGHFMVRKNGRFGKFLACSNYPECSNIKSEDSEISEVKCEKCGAHMIIKSGKFGKFLACPNYPECKNTKPYGEEKSEERCEKCGAQMYYRNGKFGKYLYCAHCMHTRNLSEQRGVCPECGKPTLRMVSKNGNQYFRCSGQPECDFISWDEPTGEKCPKCGSAMVYGRDGKTKRCSGKNCDYRVKTETQKPQEKEEQ